MLCSSAKGKAGGRKRIVDDSISDLKTCRHQTQKPVYSSSCTGCFKRICVSVFVFLGPFEVTCVSRVCKSVKPPSHMAAVKHYNTRTHSEKQWEGEIKR